MKKVIRYNLSHSEKYSCIDSYYTGGIDNCIYCDNCNRPITNVVVIKDTKDNFFNVGLDCAETLQNLIGITQVADDFKVLKKIRAYHNKQVKAGAISIFKITYLGTLSIDYENYEKIVPQSISLDFAKKYCPDYLKNVINPEKLNFIFTEHDIDLPFGKGLARDYIGREFNFTVADKQVNISVREGKKLDGTSNGSYLFVVYIEGLSQSVYMYKSLKDCIVILLNKIAFSKLN